MKRVYVGCLLYEANTSSPLRTDLEAFQDTYLAEGEETRGLIGANVEVGGFYSAMDRHEGISVVPGFVTWGVPGGKVTDETFRTLAHRLYAGIRMAGKLDGVYLSLHGAMVADGEDDCEGLLLQEVRALVGDAVRIVVSLDWHACMTRRMLMHADAFVGYRTYPHTDLADTGRRAADCMLRLLSHGRRVRKLFARVPLIVPVEHCSTDTDPSAAVVGMLSRLDGAAGVLTVVHSMTQPWLDVEDNGTSLLVCCDEDADLQDLAAKRDEVLRFIWESRHAYTVPVLDFTGFMARLASLAAPVCAVDLGDVITAGGPGDSTFILRKLLENRVTTKALITIIDPGAVAVARAAAAGSVVDVELGSASRGYNARTRVKARILRVTDKPFTPKGPALSGFTVNAGWRALLEVGAIRLLVAQHTAFLHDPEAYRSMECEPSRAALIIQKSHQLFKPAYRDIMNACEYVDTPGPTARDLALHGFQKVRRPIYPLDDLTDFVKSEEYEL
jgi:microcystin degradation protein MlrC